MDQDKKRLEKSQEKRFEERNDELLFPQQAHIDET